MSGFWAAARMVWLEAPLKHTTTLLGLSAFISYGCYNYYVRGDKLRRQHYYAIALVYNTGRSKVASLPIAGTPC